MLKKLRLRKIFKYYKKKYKLKTKLFFEDNEKCCFSLRQNCISYDLTYVIEKAKNNHIVKQLIKQYKRKELTPIFALLHEMGHAIDWEYNNEQYKKEEGRMDYFLYKFNYRYAISQPFEKRANKFAKKELKKWINI